MLGDAGVDRPGAGPVGRGRRPPPPAAGPPRFAEVTEGVGVDFVRFDGREPGRGGTIEGGRRMFEWTGGGVAAFDYDADGRPDLFFTQGREWGDGNDPPPAAPTPPRTAGTGCSATPTARGSPT